MAEGGGGARPFFNHHHGLLELVGSVGVEAAGHRDGRAVPDVDPVLRLAGLGPDEHAVVRGHRDAVDGRAGRGDVHVRLGGDAGGVLPGEALDGRVHVGLGGRVLRGDRVEQPGGARVDEVEVGEDVAGHRGPPVVR